jgi:hypothetical protein
MSEARIRLISSNSESGAQLRGSEGFDGLLASPLASGLIDLLDRRRVQQYRKVHIYLHTFLALTTWAVDTGDGHEWGNRAWAEVGNLLAIDARDAVDFLIFAKTGSRRALAVPLSHSSTSRVCLPCNGGPAEYLKKPDVDEYLES